jgi:hypothetical protein
MYLFYIKTYMEYSLDPQPLLCYSQILTGDSRTITKEFLELEMNSIQNVQLVYNHKGPYPINTPPFQFDFSSEAAMKNWDVLISFEADLSKA